MVEIDLVLGAALSLVVKHDCKESGTTKGLVPEYKDLSERRVVQRSLTE